MIEKYFSSERFQMDQGWEFTILGPVRPIFELRGSLNLDSWLLLFIFWTDFFFWRRKPLHFHYIFKTDSLVKKKVLC